MKNWSDQKLLDFTRSLVDEERRLTLEVIKHLREVKARRIYAKRGFASFWDFMTDMRDGFRYSEPAAQRRIETMKLLEDVPEAEAWVEKGRLSLSACAEASRVSRKFKIPAKILLNHMLDKSYREAKRALMGNLSGKDYRETIRELPGGAVEVRLVLSQEQRQRLEKLKDLRSHEKTHFRLGRFFSEWVESELSRLDPKLHVRTTTSKVTNPYSPKIPRALRAQVMLRDQGRCTYADPLTGRRCDACRLLQIDHIIPRALGGKNELGNLRILCREHNLLAAAEVFGEHTMEGFRRH